MNKPFLCTLFNKALANLIFQFVCHIIVCDQVGIHTEINPGRISSMYSKLKIIGFYNTAKGTNGLMNLPGKILITREDFNYPGRF